MRQKTKDGHQNQQLALPFGGWGEAPADQVTRVEVQSAVAESATLGTAAAPAETPVAAGKKEREAGTLWTGCEGGLGEVLPRCLMEAVVESGNMARALRRVRGNKGSPGVDGMSVSQLSGYLREHWPRLRAALLDGSYQPQAIRRVEIPKPDGGVRQLGIPTVVDRLIQQAVLQVLEPYYDPTFSSSSYGFRPGKSAHQALAAARNFVAEGCGWVVDMDLEKFFDRVNHDILMGRLARRIGDKRLLRVIRRFLSSGILQEGVVVGRREGTPQGGPLSPLLSNILLDDLDKELERHGLRFCRYADDCNIYVRSLRAGVRVMAWVTNFLERKLRLPVNATKSAVDRPLRRKFLGQRIIGRRQAYLGVHPKSVQRFKEALRRLTRRNRGVSLGRVLDDLRRLNMGWVSYHRHARCKELLQELDGWLRRRLRCYIWTQWKNWRHRARQLCKLGIGRYLAYGTATNGDGPWKTSKTPALTRSLTDQWFAGQGYRSLHARYLALSSLGTAGCGPACPVV